jgi:hypothetical protein
MLRSGLPYARQSFLSTFAMALRLEAQLRKEDRRNIDEHIPGNADLLIIILETKSSEILVNLLPEFLSPIGLEKDLVLG